MTMSITKCVCTLQFSIGTGSVTVTFCISPYSGLEATFKTSCCFWCHAYRGKKDIQLSFRLFNLRLAVVLDTLLESWWQVH